MSKYKNEQSINTLTHQFRVRSKLKVGESVDACLNNVAYWQKVYTDKCKKQGVDVTPYIQSYT